MCKAGVTKEQGDGFVTHMEGNSVSPSRHLTHLSLRRATPTKPHRSKDAFWTGSAPMCCGVGMGQQHIQHIGILHWNEPVDQLATGARGHREMCGVVHVRGGRQGKLP